MYKYIFILLIAIIPFSSNAQNNIENKNTYSMPSRDYVMLQLGYEGWAGKPDSIKTGGIGRSFNGYICYDFPILKSNFSFAAGVGVSVNNIYFKNQIVNFADTSTQVLFQPEPVDYKKYKLTTTYLEAPFEFRYFSNKNNRNEGFKAAIGMKVGTLTGAHTKGKRTLENKPYTEKATSKRYFDNMRYAATLRLGYGNFSVYGQYSLSNLFKLNQGPDNIRTYQLGICITGL